MANTSNDGFATDGQISANAVEAIVPNFSELSPNSQCMSFGVYDESRGAQWLSNRSISYAFNYDTSLYNSYFSESQEESHRYRTAPALITHDMTYHQPYCQLDTTFHESNTSSENGQIATNDDSVGAYPENNSNILTSQRNSGSDEEIQRINPLLPSMRNGRNIFAEVLLRNVYSESENNNSGTDILPCNANDTYMQFNKPLTNNSDISSHSSCSSSPSDLSAINGDLNSKSTVIRYLSEGSYPGTASHLKYFADNGLQSSTPQNPNPSFLANQTSLSSNGLTLSPEDRNGSLVGTGYTSVIVEAQHYQHFASSGYVQ